MVRIQTIRILQDTVKILMHGQIGPNGINCSPILAHLPSKSHNLVNCSLVDIGVRFSLPQESHYLDL